MKMKKSTSIMLSFLSLLTFVSCSSLKKEIYSQAYIIIKNKYKKNTESYYRKNFEFESVYGIKIVDSIYLFEKENDLSDNDILRTNIRKLKNKYLNSMNKLSDKNDNWVDYKLYLEENDKNLFNIKKFKGPSHFLFFSEINNNSLLGVVYQHTPDLYKSKEDYGSIDKFLFFIENKKIIKTLNITNYFD